jgi:hypothetical protein
MYPVIGPADNVLLMVEHQNGLLQVVNDLSVRSFGRRSPPSRGPPHRHASP